MHAVLVERAPPGHQHPALPVVIPQRNQPTSQPTDQPTDHDGVHRPLPGLNVYDGKMQPGVVSRSGYAVINDTSAVLLAPNASTHWPSGWRRYVAFGPDFHRFDCFELVGPKHTRRKMRSSRAHALRSANVVGDLPVLRPISTVRPRAHAPSSYVDLLFFGHGSAFRDALRDYTAIGGAVPLMPWRAYGVWWSRYHRYSASSFVAEVLDGFDTHALPLHSVVLDTDWHTGRGYDPATNCTRKTDQGYNWNRTLFPDPVAFQAMLHSKNLSLTLNVHDQGGPSSWNGGLIAPVGLAAPRPR